MGAEPGPLSVVSALLGLAGRRVSLFPRPACNVSEVRLIRPRLGRLSLKPPLRPARRQKEGMFTIIRKFRLTHGSAEEISRRVRARFVPLLQELPGFRGYYLLEGGPDVLISIRVFDSADEALASNEIAATWMRENVLEFVKGMPEVMAGNVLVAADK